MPRSPCPRPPVCRHCGVRMRYAVIKPTKVHPKLRRLFFVCVCGRASEEVLEVGPRAA